MKNIILLAVLAFSFISVNGQNAIANHFSQLADDKEATNINITGKMFQMFNSMEIESDDKDFNEMQEFLGAVTSFQMVVSDSQSNAKSQFKNGNKNLARDYEELLSVDDKEGYFVLYVHDDDGVVREVVGLGHHDDKIMVFSLLGELRMDQIAKIAETINQGEFDQMKKLKDINIEDVRVYPNPVTSQNHLTLETPEIFTGSVAELYNANGEMVKTYKVKSTRDKLDMGGLVSGQYVLSVKQNGLSVKKKVLVID